MARGGRIPDPRSVHRNPLVPVEEVADEPFDYAAAGRGLSDAREWHRDTRHWFRVVASVPHAARWRDDDWLAVADLALLKDRFYNGLSATTEVVEIRRREALLGITSEARARSRIVYVTAERAAGFPRPVSTFPTTPSARDRLRGRA